MELRAQMLTFCCFMSRGSEEVLCLWPLSPVSSINIYETVEDYLVSLHRRAKSSHIWQLLVVFVCYNGIFASSQPQRKEEDHRDGSVVALIVAQVWLLVSTLNSSLFPLIPAPETFNSQLWSMDKNMSRIQRTYMHNTYTINANKINI